MAKYDYLVVGAGLFGSVVAHELRACGKHVLVVDRRAFTAGNLLCENVEGIYVHTYGAHIFHTDNRKVWGYVNSLVEMNHFVNSPIANYRGKIYNLPFNMNTFSKLWGVVTPAEAEAEIARQRACYAHITAPKNFEEQALVLCGHDIYEILIKGYTEKQWGRSATELPADIIKRVPFRLTYDNNYFNDAYQGIPEGGYNRLIDALLEGVEVRLNTDFESDRAELSEIADRIVYTGQIDRYFDYSLGHLEYRSLRFDTKTLDTANYQGNAVVNYTSPDVPYTRVIEHKHFAHGTQPKTVVTWEYPQEWRDGLEPYYPINDERNNTMAAAYKELASQQDKVVFGGRLGSYAYFDMDDTIAAALELVDKELKR